MHKQIQVIAIEDKEVQKVIDMYKSHPEFLGDEIVDINQEGGISEDTLIHIAARKGAVNDMKIMVSAGADIDYIGDMGNTPLHHAVMFNKIDSVRFLLSLGAKINIKNEFGKTAYETARAKGFEEIAKLINCTSHNLI